VIDEVIRLQYRHNTWAMTKVYDAAEQLSAEQRAIPGVAGHGSIHDTLLHALQVQQGWFACFDGSLPLNEALQLTIDPDGVADFSALRTKWESVNARTMAFINQATDDQLTRDLLIQTPWTPDRVVPLWTMMLHVHSDSAQHRSEVAAMLTEHGSSPGFLDLAYYILTGAIDAE
jgi:uncharacterized damage-inducible protein DinB